MTTTEALARIDSMAHALWKCQDKTDKDMSVFDWLNIADCARKRAMAQAGISSEGFSGEYHACRALIKKAAHY